MMTKSTLPGYGLGLFFISLFALTIGITGCSEDVNPSEKRITSFVFLLTQNPINANVIGQIDEGARTITAIMPEGTDVNGLIPAIEVSPGATVSPTTAQNFNNPVIYTVTGEDGGTATYTATVTAALSQREILQIILDENPGNTLGWVIPNSGDLGSLDGVTTDVNGDIIELEMVGKSIRVIPPEIGQLSQLRVLILDFNGLTSLPSEIGQLSALEVLLLNNNQLTSLPGSIWSLSNLISLKVAFNDLTTVPAEIGQLTNLEECSFFCNDLSAVPPEIGHLTMLRILNLGDNRLNSLPPEIGFLTNLELLDISINNLASKPRSICNLDTFNDLDLIDDALPCTNPPSEMDALISIYAANPDNTLGWGVDDYPGVVFTTEGSPRSISASNRNLVRIRFGISSLASLEVLSLNSNSFGAHGSLTSDIGNVSTLTTLALDNTGISTVPASFGNLENLTLLSLQNNPLTSIPQEVCDLQVSNGGILTILTDQGEECP